MACVTICEEVDVDRLQSEHQLLRAEHDALKLAIKERLKAELHEQSTASAVTITFALRCMATIAGWMTAETFNAVLLRWTLLDDAGQQKVLARGVYAALVTLLVPTCQWGLQHLRPEVHWRQDQVSLLKTCLPMLFAWGWKNFVSAILDLCEDEFWPELVTTVFLTSMVILAELLPCYKAANRKIQRGGEDRTLLARLMVCPGHIGLAVGYAWNLVASYSVKKVQLEIQSPLFIFMVQAVYYVLITFVITFFTSAAELDDPEVPKGADKDATMLQEGVLKAGEELRETSESVVLDAMHFVFAWAQLDTVNALFFTYLLGCGGARTCSYQSNFALSLVVTFVFSRFAAMLKLTTSRTRWQSASAKLIYQALVINVGWAWANYCYTAVASSSTAQGVSVMTVYIICSLFGWFAMSIAHHRFMVERRAWDRYIREQVGFLEAATARQVSTTTSTEP